MAILFWTRSFITEELIHYLQRRGETAALDERTFVHFNQHLLGRQLAFESLTSAHGARGTSDAASDGPADDHGVVASLDVRVIANYCRKRGARKSGAIRGGRIGAVQRGLELELMGELGRQWVRQQELRHVRVLVDALVHVLYDLAPEAVFGGDGSRVASERGALLLAVHDARGRRRLVQLVSTLLHLGVEVRVGRRRRSRVCPETIIRDTSFG